MGKSLIYINSIQKNKLSVAYLSGLDEWNKCNDFVAFILVSGAKTYYKDMIGAVAQPPIDLRWRKMLQAIALLQFHPDRNASIGSCVPK